MSGDRDIIGELDHRLPALQVGFTHGQFHVHGDASWRQLADAPQRRALDDADEGEVGSTDGLVAFLCPADFHFDATPAFEVWTGEPPLEHDDDQVVDIDLDMPHGAVDVEITDGPEHARTVWLRTAGSYRSRLEGHGYTAHQDTRRVQREHDSYRIQLWPRFRDQPATLRREWPGWNHVVNPAFTDGVPADTTPTGS